MSPRSTLKSCGSARLVFRSQRPTSVIASARSSLSRPVCGPSRRCATSSAGCRSGGPNRRVDLHHPELSTVNSFMLVPRRVWRKDRPLRVEPDPHRDVGEPVTPGDQRPLSVVRPLDGARDARRADRGVRASASLRCDASFAQSEGELEQAWYDVDLHRPAGGRAPPCEQLCLDSLERRSPPVRRRGTRRSRAGSREALQG